MRRHPKKVPLPVRAVACATAGALLLSGCGRGFTGVQDLPLPGGADLGDDPYTVTAEFANVLDLVPQAAVKVNDVAVGRVSKVSLPLDGWTARVTMVVNGKVRLPANATARLEQSSLLGEKYIQLAAPPVGATGTLADGARIPAARTNRNVEVEEVFGALSMLLNGGGLPQLRTISRELNNALTGNEPEIKSVLRRINELTSSLDANKGDIVAALDGLNRLSATLSTRKEKLGTVLGDLSPGLKVLEEQRGALITMLRQFEDLSDVAVRTINASQDDMVADLRALAPTLRKLADAGEDLPKSLQVLFTYPFTDEALNAIKGDYLNVYLSVTATPGTEIIPPISPEQSGRAARETARKARDTPTLPLPPADTPSIVQPPVVPGTPSPSRPAGPTAPGTPSGGGGGIFPEIPGGSTPSPSGSGGRG
ncbi:MCE family protein [Actinomadura viridis]|uniref:Phospholipid/cholesterol/gamma-HCH transport system substrate-binding protein n=1 Tax=Actinomadura viridis TaxID=58110 RepID=A0A931DJV6_9ACTN|nr:MCE family protein [Actinomadura viridis]MBG6091360.1 phospholipid/cholesterol/gamma-HCH transport system substrate-binding protein [Actinomadura viridis]